MKASHRNTVLLRQVRTANIAERWLTMRCVFGARLDTIISACAALRTAEKTRCIAKVPWASEQMAAMLGWISARLCALSRRAEAHLVSCSSEIRAGTMAPSSVEHTHTHAREVERARESALTLAKRSTRTQFEAHYALRTPHGLPSPVGAVFE